MDIESDCGRRFSKLDLLCIESIAVCSVQCLTTMSATNDGDDGHGTGMCSLSYFVQDGATKLISCGADGKLALRDADRPESISATAPSASVLPMTCLAVHPSGSSVVVGHAAEGANFVKVPSCYMVTCLHGCAVLEGALTAHLPPPQVYKLPSLDFDKVATRPTLPVRCAAFSPSGSSVAAAGDEGGIKLVNLADSKVVLQTSTCPMTNPLCMRL